MPNDLLRPDPARFNLTDPARFNLTSFADLLPVRDHIIGEDPGSFDGFHAGVMHSLAPLTPYEGVIAENLIAIEWELLQHRRMRDASLRKIIRESILAAVVAREKAAVDETWAMIRKAGGTQIDETKHIAFDQDGAETMGLELAQKATSRKPAEFAAACEEIDAMGLSVVELMGDAYRTDEWSVSKHEGKLQELERRRREVKRDFDGLQKVRPIEVEVIEVEVIEG